MTTHRKLVGSSSNLSQTRSDAIQKACNKYNNGEGVTNHTNNPKASKVIMLIASAMSTQQVERLCRQFGI